MRLDRIDIAASRRWGEPSDIGLGYLTVYSFSKENWTRPFEEIQDLMRLLKGFIRKDLVDAVADGRRPAGMSADEEMTFDFASELVNNKRVSDPTYGRALDRFGRRGVVDLAALVGYYGLLAAAMNTARTALPGGGTRLPRFPE